MKQRVCIFHQNLSHDIGGSQAVCVWILEALKKKFDLFLATSDKNINFNHINHIYGTNLSKKEIEFIPLSIPPLLKKSYFNKMKSLKLSFTIKQLKRQGKSFDLVINTMNEIALPFPSIQYIHCPLRNSKTIREIYNFPESLMRIASNMLFKLISGSYSKDLGKTKSVFVANSNWTANAFKSVYGLDIQVIYPPVTPIEKVYETKLNKRELGFVTIGRFSRDKRLHEAIHIIDRLKNVVNDVHLHIVGNGKGKYADKIKEMAKQRDYVFIHTDIPRKEISNLMRSHRFGIHTMKYEHFGIAPAEILMAGAIVFVHKSGGQIEIVNNLEDLIFENTADAIQKILRLITDETRQKNILYQIEPMRELFSVKTFVRKINNLIEEILIR